jgi:hypothetical protein
MTSHQLQKTARIWQGLSDPITSRGSFSSPPGAYPNPETGTACPMLFLFRNFMGIGHVLTV